MESSRPAGTTLLRRRLVRRSKISASAMMDAAINGQIGQPAARMMSNTCAPFIDKRRTVAREDGRGNPAGTVQSGCSSPGGRLSTEIVDNRVGSQTDTAQNRRSAGVFVAPIKN
jgi:hypothetical protein